MDEKAINKKVAIATRWSTITEFAAKCVTPLTNMILARLLAPEAFGVVATVTVVVSFANMFTDAGFQKYLMQHDFCDEEELDCHTNVAFWTNFAFSVALWAIIFAFRTPIARLLGNPGLGNVVSVAALSLPLVSFSSIQMARFKRNFDFRSLFFIRLVSVSVPLLVTIPLAFFLRNYWALVIGTLVGNLVNAVVLTARSQWKPKAFFRFQILKEMFSYSSWILVESIAVWLSFYAGTFIVGIFLSDYYVGLYKTSISTVNQILDLVVAATSAPLFVALSRLKNDHDSMLSTYSQFIKGLSAFIMPLGVGIWLYRDLVTGILLGQQWVEAADFVGLWGLTSTLTLLLGTYCNGLYNAKGKTWLSCLAQVLHLAVMIPVLLWAAPQGFGKLYVARGLVRLELVVVQFVIMKVCMKAPILRLLKSLLPATVCTALMAGCALCLRTVGDSFLWQLCGVAICILVYFGIFVLLFKKQLTQALEMLGIGFITRIIPCKGKKRGADT